MASSPAPSLKAPMKQVYQIGKAAVERGLGRGGKGKNMMESMDDEEPPEPPKQYIHKQFASKIVAEGSGNEFTILSRVALIRAHSRVVEGDPEAEKARERITHHRFVPEDNEIHVTITDGRSVWKGAINYGENNIVRVRSGGRDETWKKDYFLTIVSDTLRDPRAVRGMRFFLQEEEESGGLSFVIKEMRDSVRPYLSSFRTCEHF